MLTDFFLKKIFLKKNCSKNQHPSTLFTKTVWRDADFSKNKKLIKNTVHFSSLS